MYPPLVPSDKPLIRSLDDLPLTPDLVEGLDKLVPHRCPLPDQSEREIWMYAGKRQLVDALKTAMVRRIREGRVV
ncbi:MULTISPECIES: hypothetical protein [Desulfovibrio]|uniref:hypothetical protein n=1 Tax=Desulfovibrio TaxID=872 RepID=UPI002666743E|nr:hypothetical protein [Desulfovibrio piger]